MTEEAWKPLGQGEYQIEKEEEFIQINVRDWEELKQLLVIAAASVPLGTAVHKQLIYFCKKFHHE